MNNLYIIFDTLFSGYFPSILDILSLLAIGFAVLVITLRNPVISVLFLIGLFFGVACYLISIGIGFIGLSYLLVYVGAVSILFLFILMLINIRVSELVSETKNSISLVIIVSIIFLNARYVILPVNDHIETSISTWSNWENILSEFNHINSIGNVMYTNLAIWLIIASLILLLAMVGAIVITIKPENREPQFYSFILQSNLAHSVVIFQHLYDSVNGNFSLLFDSSLLDPHSHSFILHNLAKANELVNQARTLLLDPNLNQTMFQLAQSKLVYAQHFATHGNWWIASMQTDVVQSLAANENLGTSDILAHVKALAAAKANLALNTPGRILEAVQLLERSGQL